jgi:hypothetical protein
MSTAPSQRDVVRRSFYASRKPRLSIQSLHG